MHRALTSLPLCITIAACGFLLAYGPIAQLPDYHEFADRSSFAGIPHAGDVLSNIGFALVGIWGWLSLQPAASRAFMRDSWTGYRLFFLGLILTALGSGFYHLAPDNARLVWDRLPIALACAGLLTAVRAETHPNVNAPLTVACLTLFACASVAWWYVTDLRGQGDLRPYLLIQALPLILIPIWQSLYSSPRHERISFGLALALYVIAKVAELYDHQIASALGWISGHTLKHLLAAAGAAVLTGTLITRAPRIEHRRAVAL